MKKFFLDSIDHNDQTRSYKLTIRQFYTDFNEVEVEKVNSDRIKELQEKAKRVQFNKMNPKPLDYSPIGRYANTLAHIRMNSKRYNLHSTAEQFLLFMFHIDPTFEAFKIFSESNNMDEVKQKMHNRFGVYHCGLIKTEKAYITKLMKEKERQLIEEEIEERVYC